MSRRLPFLELTKEDHPLRRVCKIRRRQVCVEDAQRTVMSEASPSIPPHLPGSVQESYQSDCSALFVISRRPSSRGRQRTIPRSAYVRVAPGSHLRVAIANAKSSLLIFSRSSAWARRLLMRTLLSSEACSCKTRDEDWKAIALAFPCPARRIFICYTVRKSERL